MTQFGLLIGEYHVVRYAIQLQHNILEKNIPMIRTIRFCLMSEILKSNPVNFCHDCVSLEVSILWSIFRTSMVMSSHFQYSVFRCQFLDCLLFLCNLV